MPELFLLENIDGFPLNYDDVEPEDELLSFLEEIITEDEKKTEGSKTRLYSRANVRNGAYIIMY